MLIFNGKTYFVPFIGSDKVAGADATPDQVEEGVKFVGANGVVEDGKLPFYDGTDMNAAVYDSNDEYAYIQSWVDKKSIIEDVVYSKVPLSQFGNAEAEYVVEGQTFTSATGYQSTGILPIQEGFLTPDEMRDYDGDDNLYVSCPTGRSLVESGVAVKIPLSNFGNATAADVRAGVKFTSADGWYEEGEMPTIALPEATIHFDVDSGRILSVVTNNEDGFVEKGETSAVTYLRTKKAAVIEPSNTTQIAVQKNYWTTGDVTVAPIPDYYIDASDMSVFGNATAADVRKGKSFTSADGVNEEGTMEAASLTNGTGWYRDANYIYVEPYVSKGYSDGIYDQWYCDARTLDANLIPANIAEGTSIFGITGTHKGGSEIKTCTVTVNIVDSVGYLGVTATQFANGAITTFRENKSSGTFTIPNVVCGSIITIVCNGYFSIDGWSFPSQVGSTSLALIAPNTTGDYSANIIAYDD